MVKILSFHSGHDANISAVEDGAIRLHVEFERVFNKKHYINWQRDAIPQVLPIVERQLGWTLDDVDWIALTSMRSGDGREDFFGATCLSEIARPYEKLYKADRPYATWIVDGRKVIWVTHHVAHAALAYYTSPHDDAALLSIDGSGEFYRSHMTAVGEGRKLKACEFFSDNSLGHLYSNIAAVLPEITENALDAAGQAMGLSSYGQPRDEWRERVRQLIATRPLSWATMRAFRRKLKKVDLRTAKSQDARDLMATIQDEFELWMIDAARKLVAQHGKRTLCIGGGCALNVQSNSRLLAEGVVDRLYVPPACSDCGLSLGSALYLYHTNLGYDFRGLNWHDPFVGLEVRNFELLNGARRLSNDELFGEAASRIADGQIAAWVQGRSEIGPRALGNRSILADPRRTEIKNILNERVKRRQWWRPFAPVCIEEDADEWFEIDRPQPYMLEAPVVKNGRAGLIPAVVHVDKTARLQTVSENQNRKLWLLLREFKAHTGVPVLLNTSLNDQGKPICNDVEIVLDFLRRKAIDFAVVKDRVVTSHA